MKGDDGFEFPPPLLCLLTNNLTEAEPDLLVKTATKANIGLGLAQTRQSLARLETG